ncbi:WD40 repeat-like protein, partial [Rhizoctonia solani]
MEFRDRSSLAHKRNRVYQQPKSVSVSLFLDEVGKPLEPSVPWQHTYPCLDDHGHEPETECARWSSRTCVPLDLYKPNSPSFPLSVNPEQGHQLVVRRPKNLISFPSLDSNCGRADVSCPGAPKSGYVPLPPCRCDTHHNDDAIDIQLELGLEFAIGKTRAAVPVPTHCKTRLRVLAWLKDVVVEPAGCGPWVSFLPMCESSIGSDLSLSSAVWCGSVDIDVDVDARVEHESESEIGSGYEPESEPEPETEPEPSSFAPVMDDMTDTESRETCVQEIDTWPYDGRGLYEHHPNHECGLACYFACRQRRQLRRRGRKGTFRTGGSFGKALLGRLVPWTSSSGKRVVVRAREEGPVMLNSDVPHPPWWLSYRSNDDTLEEDEDDGDLELWLEHTTQMQLLDHEMRFQLALNQHTAFCLRQEARLDISPNAKVHIPRGGLITLLQKALLYIEVETHWSNDGKPNSCTSPFSLLANHVCASSMPASPGGTPQGRNGTKADKRRTSPKSANRQKRARLENQENKDKETTPGLGSRGPPQSSGTPNKKKTPNAKAKPAKPPAVITLKGHSLEVFVVAWNPKIPSLLATGGKDSTLRLWNVPEDGTEPILPTRICMHLPAGPACDITTISWNSDGTLLATGAYDGIVRVWTFRGELFCVMTQHQGPIFSVKWSKSGWLLTGSLDETAIVWDVDAGGRPKQRTSSDRSMADGCLDVEWLDGEFFATCGSDRNIFVECIGETTPIAKLQGHNDEINQLKYESEYKLLASGSDDYTACIWKVDDVAQYLAQSSKNIKPRPDVRSFTHKLRGHEGEVANIQWQPKGDRETYDPILVTSSFDGTVRMWNGHTGDCISIFQAGSGKVCGHSFAPRPDILAIVAGNKLILAKDGKEFFSWQDKDALFETAWRVDGKAVAAAMENSMVAVVRMPSITIPGEEDKAETA